MYVFRSRQGRHTRRVCACKSDGQLWVLAELQVKRAVYVKWSTFDDACMCVYVRVCQMVEIARIDFTKHPCFWLDMLGLSLALFRNLEVACIQRWGHGSFTIFPASIYGNIRVRRFRCGILASTPPYHVVVCLRTSPHVQT